MYIYKYIHTYICIYMYTLYTCINTNLCIYFLDSMYTYMYLYIYSYICLFAYCLTHLYNHISLDFYIYGSIDF